MGLGSWYPTRIMGWINTTAAWSFNSFSISLEASLSRYSRCETWRSRRHPPWDSRERSGSRSCSLRHRGGPERRRRSRILMAPLWWRQLPIGCIDERETTRLAGLSPPLARVRLGRGWRSKVKRYSSVPSASWLTAKSRTNRTTSAKKLLMACVIGTPLFPGS